MYLYSFQVDVKPRIEAFWFLGGIEWTEDQKKKKKELTENVDFDSK